MNCEFEASLGYIARLSLNAPLPHKDYSYPIESITVNGPEIEEFISEPLVLSILFH
jgi:hypothetical protein